MDKNDIKKLAKLTTASNKMSNEIADFVLTSFTRRQLLVYLKFLKAFEDKHVVRIFSKERLLEADQKKITKLFQGKTFVFEQNEDVGEGIIAQINDTVINLSLVGFVNQAIENLMVS